MTYSAPTSSLLMMAVVTGIQASRPSGQRPAGKRAYCGQSSMFVGGLGVGWRSFVGSKER